MNDTRIRLDLKSAGKAFITKSSVVAAVRLLEQDTSVNLLKSSQEVANWVTLHLTATHAKPLSVVNVRVCITWVEDPKTSVDGVVNPVHNVKGDLHVTDEGIIHNGVPSPASEVLPQFLANLIKETPVVELVEQDKDSFL